MPWFKVDDQLHSHPKARRVGLEALGLWAVAGSHCMAYKTDGFVPEWFAHQFPRGRRLAGELVRAGLWQNTTREGEAGYVFHDWCHYQQSAKEIEQDREHNRQRQRAWRAKLRDGKQDQEA